MASLKVNKHQQIDPGNAGNTLPNFGTQLIPKYPTSSEDAFLVLPWDLYRGEYPIANDIPSVHKICQPVFDKLLLSADVYIHGSFARGLQTVASDINLYIPSLSRDNLNEIWSQSPMQKASFGDPKVGVSINEYLREDLGREVTICCSDDPWLWVERDVKYRIFPTLEEDFEIPHVFSTDQHLYLANILRKCYYEILGTESEETKISILATDNSPTCYNAQTNEVKLHFDREPDSPSRVLRLYEIINRLYYLLESIDEATWRKYLPAFPNILTWIDELGQLSSEAYRHWLQGDFAIEVWKPMYERYRDFASELFVYGGVAFQDRFELVWHSKPDRQSTHLMQIHLFSHLLRDCTS